jgi:hypothetical protein
MLSFYSLLGYGRDNADGNFRQFALAVPVTGRTIIVPIGFMGSG